MRHTLDPFFTMHRPLLLYGLTMGLNDSATSWLLNGYGFVHQKSGTLSYWVRSCGKPNHHLDPNPRLPVVFVHGIGIGVSPYKDNDLWQRAFVQMDLSFEQRITPGIVLYVKVNNLLNTPMRADILLPNTFNAEQAPYWDASESTLAWEDFYFQTYLVGMKFNLQQYKNNPKKDAK